MTTRMTLMASAAALAALVGTSAQAQAQAPANKEIEELRQELQKLRQEVSELKRTTGAAKPADSSGWGERIEQVELKQKDAVVAGDIAGSFRLPGSETSVRLYGYAEAHLIHDINATAPGDDFTNLIEQPLTSAGQNKGKTRLTAQASRFGVESATPTQYGTFNTKLEMDFYAYGSDNRNRLRVRHAYGEYAGFLVGQTWSTFMDLDDLPETVDFNGPIGSPFSRRTMVRYTYGDAKAGYKFAFAAEDPADGARMPNLVARLDKSFDGGGFNVRVLSHEKRSAAGYSKRGYGVGFGGSYKLNDKDLLMGQWARVKGDTDMLYGANGFADDGQRLLFDRNDGLVLGWAHTFSDQLRSNVVFGMNRARVTDEFIAAFEDPSSAWYANRRLQQLHAGAIYSPIKNVELGAEYVYGRRKTSLYGDGRMSRLDLMARYSF